MAGVAQVWLSDDELKLLLIRVELEPETVELVGKLKRALLATACPVDPGPSVRVELPWCPTWDCQS
jgi:hypothetical protein